MSIKADRVLDLFRNCRNLHHSTNANDGSFEKLRDKYPNYVALHEQRLSVATKKTARILDFLSPKTDGKNTKREKKITFEEPRDTLRDDLQRLVRAAIWRTASVEYSRLYRMLAVACFERGHELGAVQLLTESHSIILQQQIFHRYSKTQIRNQYLTSHLEPGIRPVHINYDPISIMESESLLEKLSVMPKEWYMVQLTVVNDELDYQKANGTVVESTCPLHITILPTGPSAVRPFSITLPSPNKENYDGVKELVKILKTNKADLEAYYSSNSFYWKMREKQNNKLKSAITELEHSWLREWRILLIADSLKSTKLVKEMTEMIDKLIADDLSAVKICDRTRWLLHKIATSSCYLSKIEIARAVSYVLRRNTKLASNVILSLNGKLNSANDLRSEKRKTMILIIDESLDHVPFESMGILKSHPVTRFPSFHVAYAIFKEHESTIVNGCKIVKRGEKFGSFIINAERNLNKMEKRMKLFINYWLPEWDGIYGVKPTETHYEQLLVDRDVLLYAGHGSGIQFLPGEKIEKLRVRSSVFLFGCSSVKLYPVGGIFPPLGVSNQYLIACSPCIVGMLWEVTDGDTDRMTSRFLSDWISSKADRAWSDVDLTEWTDGNLKFTNSTEREILDCTSEPEMLRAIARAKEICTQEMTAAAIIVRGLPLRLES